jgi:hypothetical protein
VRKSGIIKSENADFALPRVIQTVLSVQRSQTDKTVCITFPEARLQPVFDLAFGLFLPVPISAVIDVENAIVLRWIVRAVSEGDEGDSFLFE